MCCGIRGRKSSLYTILSVVEVTTWVPVCLSCSCPFSVPSARLAAPSHLRRGISVYAWYMQPVGCPRVNLHRSAPRSVTGDSEHNVGLHRPCGSSGFCLRTSLRFRSRRGAGSASSEESELRPASRRRRARPMARPPVYPAYCIHALRSFLAPSLRTCVYRPMTCTCCQSGVCRAARVSLTSCYFCVFSCV